jgi:hypothetical protein
LQLVVFSLNRLVSKLLNSFLSSFGTLLFHTSRIVDETSQRKFLRTYRS